jgi:hypothetical protein
MAPRFFRTAAVGVLCLVCVLIARVVEAQPLRGVVVDQTGLPLPGAMVQLRNGDAVIATVVTGATDVRVSAGSERSDARRLARRLRNQHHRVD